MAMEDHEELIRRKASFLVRTEHYLSLGYDRFATADFVVKTGGRLSGPALDIGTGKELTAMARRGLEVVFLDLDADEQALAFLLAAEAGLKDRIYFVWGDASMLTYSEDHFGCAALVDVLHHLQDPVPVLEEGCSRRQSTVSSARSRPFLFFPQGVRLDSRNSHKDILKRRTDSSGFGNFGPPILEKTDQRADANGLSGLYPYPSLTDLLEFKAGKKCAAFLEPMRNGFREANLHNVAFLFRLDEVLDRVERDDPSRDDKGDAVAKPLGFLDIVRGQGNRRPDSVQVRDVGESAWRWRRRGPWSVRPGIGFLARGQLRPRW
jgi:hypothetical protein